MHWHFPKQRNKNEKNEETHWHFPKKKIMIYLKNKIQKKVGHWRFSTRRESGSMLIRRIIGISRVIARLDLEPGEGGVCTAHLEPLDPGIN